MIADQFLKQCPGLWHVAHGGTWELIREHGLRTAEQLIQDSDLSDEDRARYLGHPRREPITFHSNGHEVTLRDQAPMLKRKDLDELIADGLPIEEWVRTLNRRVYLYADQTTMKKMLTAGLARDGVQDLLIISPSRLIDAARPRLELTAHSSGAVARQAGAQKHADSFLPLSRFPDKRPAEVTVLDGFDAKGIVVHAERHHADGRREQLSL